MINEEGFLSSELKSIEDKFENEFASLFKLVRDANIFFQECSFIVKVDISKIHLLCLAALYLRSLSTYQSIFILSKKGMTGESKVLLRSLIEIQYIILAIEKNNEIANEYLGQEVIEFEKIFKNSIQWQEKLQKTISLKEIEEKLSELKSIKRINKINKITIKQFAQKAGMLLDYETSYSLLCLTSHSNIFEIKKHFVYDSNGVLSSFNWGPNINDISSVLISSTETMFRILNSIRESFDLIIDEKFTLLFNNFSNIRVSYKMI